MNRHSLLVVVDMQNDFLTGSLANPYAVACIPVIKKAISEAGSVVFTRDAHDENYLYSQEGQNLPVLHCVKDTPGFAVDKSLIEAADNAGIWWDYADKKTFGYQWENFNLSPEIHEVVFCGTCTDICVVANVVTFKTTYPEVPVKVIEAGCAGTTPDRHAAAIEVMKSLQVEII